MSDDKCARCGEVGPDGRTLWMACFYDMAELGLPFEQCALDGVYMKKVGDEPLTIGGRQIGKTPIYEALADSLAKRSFFTLRVCKDCRADWMTAIKRWFETKIPLPGTGTGVYVRENGTARELTPLEVEERFPKGN